MMLKKTNIHRIIAIVMTAVFAVPALWGCASPGRTTIRVAPPAPRVEVRTVRPGPGYVWVSGHWRWTERRYVWVRGHWVRRPKRHAVWVAGHWTHGGGGWIWISGHWKS